MEELPKLRKLLFNQWKEVTVMTKLKRALKELSRAQRRTVPLTNFLHYLRDIERNLGILENIQVAIPPFREIVELHDVVAELHDLAVNGTTPIPHTETEKKWERKVEKYVFTLAKETSDLRKIGREMNICVGSYSDRALAKDCTIIMCEHEKERICIEVEKDIVVQAKQPFNRLPTDHQRKIILDWATKNKLRIRTHDLEENAG